MSTFHPPRRLPSRYQPSGIIGQATRVSALRHSLLRESSATREWCSKVCAKPVSDFYRKTSLTVRNLLDLRSTLSVEPRTAIFIHAHYPLPLCRSLPPGEPTAAASATAGATSMRNDGRRCCQCCDRCFELLQQIRTMDLERVAWQGQTPADLNLVHMALLRVVGIAEHFINQLRVTSDGRGDDSVQRHVPAEEVKLH